jgi:hypothetical protein
VDNSPAFLVDLSTSGAQVLSSAALKPNRTAKVTLPLGDGMIACKGKIVWARIDSSKAGQLLYRAGVAFTMADQQAINAFLAKLNEG